MKRKYIINVFDENPAQPAAQQATQPAAQPAQPAANPVTPGTYSYAQAEEIATARAAHASSQALKNWFKQQGMDDAQVQEALADYRAKKAAQTPDVAAITRERDEARAELEKIKQEGSLAKKGVSSADLNYVAFQARELMKADDKLTFDKAADKYLKDNPRFCGKTAYRVQTGPAAQAAPGVDPNADQTAARHQAVDDAFRALFGGQ